MALVRERRSIVPTTAVAEGGGGKTVVLSGDWTAMRAVECESAADGILPAVDGASQVTLDLKSVTKLDTLGSLIISRLLGDLKAAGMSARVVNQTDTQKVLLEEIQYKPQPKKPVRRAEGTIDMLTDIGKTMVNFWLDLVHGVAFLGSFMAGLWNILRGRSRFRLASLIAQLERVGLRSVPIVVLISILVGGIISQQSIFQLRQFGTVQFVADLLGVLVLRELAVLITSIMLAGRTGSSFTAELGSMKMREEIDALRTMGLDPIEVLVVPRILALLIGLPLLTFISSMAMLFGGGMVAYLYGGVTPEIFMSRLQNGIWFSTFAVGLIKAPFMALVIGIIACIEGFAVAGSAESLGSRTTASVVKAIFMVIVVDGLFAMFFAAIQF